jgi:hypothetical protein
MGTVYSTLIASYSSMMMASRMFSMIRKRIMRKDQKYTKAA